MANEAHQKLKIIHCFRSPVGGIFRHVRDLLEAQHANGHEVGIVCDSNTSGDYEEALFESIKPMLTLGLYRIPMDRSITLRDGLAMLKVSMHLRKIRPDIVHSHSAKGGVNGRIGAFISNIGGHKTKAFYCPHGGAMHYQKGTLKGMIYFTVERLLERFTDSLIFVSDYERNAYHEKVGIPRCEEEIVYNGLREDEFLPVRLVEEPADFLYIGMMRDLKGPDVFLSALKQAQETSGKQLSAYFIGDGPDKDQYIQQINDLDLRGQVTVKSAMPAREAFALAKVVVVPSRAESMPYLVLEAVAAQKPLIATKVGGIPEIFAGTDKMLVAPDNAAELAKEMLSTLLYGIDKKNVALVAENLKKKFSLDIAAQHFERIYRQA